MEMCSTGLDGSVSLEEAVAEYADMLFRIAFSVTGCAADAEDILQNVFLKFHTKKPQFNDAEHVKAWLIRVTENEAKSLLRFQKRRKRLAEDAAPLLPEARDRAVMESLLRLPPKLKTAMYLYYVEGYGSAKIAGMLGISDAAVRKRLEKGRIKLKEIYLEESYESD